MIVQWQLFTTLLSRICWSDARNDPLSSRNSQTVG